MFAFAARSALGRLWRPRCSRWAARDAARVAMVRRGADELASASDRKLAAVAAALRGRASACPGPPPDDVLLPLAGCVEAALRRVLGLSYYDVQLVGGLWLAEGAVVEMPTGEGKTITAALAAALCAARGRGVHVATVNDYLARRDFALARPLFELLGFSAGLAADGAGPDEKRAAYAADITYATGYELGFDYLRDQLAARAPASAAPGDAFLTRLRGATSAAPPVTQARRTFAIVDEVDSVLVDEANTPLVLSGAAPGKAPRAAAPGGEAAAYWLARRLAQSLKVDVDFTRDATRRRVALTATGAARVRAALPAAGAARLRRPWASHVEQALHAEWVLRRDVDYIVRGQRLLLVDAVTGRVFAERQLRDGLHQAVEVKEGLAPSPENPVAARITRQRFFGMYEQVCGLTGTARGLEAEFAEAYGLRVAALPPRAPCRRVAHAPRAFATGEAKLTALVADVARRRQHGQPVLIGARTIAASEELSARLSQAGLDHALLNGKQDADEAALVARAGQPGAITLATNLAGRGTDIRLHADAARAGGLHVVVSAPNDSARADRQLAGRAARQGDPGSVQSWLSPDDDLPRGGGGRLARRLRRALAGRVEAARDVAPDVLAAQRAWEAEQRSRRQALLAEERWSEQFLNLAENPEAAS